MNSPPCIYYDTVDTINTDVEKDGEGEDNELTIYSLHWRYLYFEST